MTDLTDFERALIEVLNEGNALVDARTERVLCANVGPPETEIIPDGQPRAPLVSDSGPSWMGIPIGGDYPLDDPTLNGTYVQAEIIPLVEVQQRDAEIQLGKHRTDDACDEAFCKLQDDLAHWQAIAQAHNDSLVERIKENTDLRTQLAACHEGYCSGEMEIKSLSAEVHQCRARIGTLSAEVERLKEDGIKFQHEIAKTASLRARVAELEGALEKITKHGDVGWTRDIARDALKGERSATGEGIIG